MGSKKIHKLDAAVVIIGVILCLSAFIAHSYRGQLFAAGFLMLFYFFFQVADEKLSKSPSVGEMCHALTDLNPEGKINYADREADAKAEEGFSIKTGQTCVITNFKRGVFTKGIYIVRPTDKQ